MAWDFETEPEFENKLEWMREFVRDEIIPLEELVAPEETFEKVMAPLKKEVRRQGLWAAHLPPDLGGGGFGQGHLPGAKRKLGIRSECHENNSYH